MKKLLVTSLMIISALCVNAQFKFGIKAGLNIANQKWTASGISITPDSKVGFLAGVILDSKFGENFAFQPGLLFSQKGMKMKANTGTSNSDFEITLNYIDVPLNLMYKANAGTVKILISAGPVISYAISGKGTSGSVSQDLNFGSGTNDDFKSMDIGLGIGGGIEVSTIQLGVNYTFGLGNIAPTNDITMKNNVLSFSVALLFGKN